MGNLHTRQVFKDFFKKFKCKINTKTNVRLVTKENINVDAMKI